MDMGLDYFKLNNKIYFDKIIDNINHIYLDIYFYKDNDLVN